jgi:hypothetical protein
MSPRRNHRLSWAYRFAAAFIALISFLPVILILGCFGVIPRLIVTDCGGEVPAVIVLMIGVMTLFGLAMGFFALTGWTPFEALSPNDQSARERAI